jgi:UDP-2,3-diacylglucosamine hydrolase
VLGHQLVIIADAHLGAVPSSVDEALLTFLDAAPALGDCLLVNGDLFEFWFSYRRAIPRSGFRVASALAGLRRRMPIAMTGGNHDRWGASFWESEADIRFGAEDLRFQVGPLRVHALHGDGLSEEHWTGRLLHRVTRHPITIGIFRSLPPDLGFWVVDRLSGRLADSTRDASALERAALAQRAWAEARLREDPELDLLIMGHTHRPCVSEPVPGRRYVNPGAWFDGLRYAIASEAGVSLHQYG